MRLEEFQTQLAGSSRPVVVDVWAPWCGPCRTLTPRLEQVAGDFDNQIDVWKINADDNRELVRSLGIMGIPTLIYFRDGREVARQTGLQSVATLHASFDALATNEPATVHTGMPDTTRWLRFLSGFALMALAVFSSSNWSPALLLLGALVIFSGVYDRCPIWQVLTARVRGSSKATADDAKLGTERRG